MAIFLPKVQSPEGIELQRFLRHFWKWHGMWTKMAAWKNLDLDFGVHKNHPTSVKCIGHEFNLAEGENTSSTIKKHP